MGDGLEEDFGNGCYYFLVLVYFSKWDVIRLFFVFFVLG